MITVALLGCGTVGGGVYERLVADGRFRIVGIARRGDDPVALAGIGADIVVELMGGMEPALTAIRAALARGSWVVTANKRVIAECGATFGPRVLYSAAVGGGVPVLRWVRRIASIERVDGVLNGTTNFVLDWEGGYEEAIAEAQRRGFAEADPTLDLNGTDAAQKISIVARLAFGRAPDVLDQEGITSGARGRLIASTWLEDGLVHAEVRLRALPPPVFAAARNEENVVVITHGGGRQFVLSGKGAGRDPTAQAVMEDIEEVVAALGVKCDKACHI